MARNVREPAPTEAALPYELAPLWRRVVASLLLVPGVLSAIAALGTAIFGLISLSDSIEKTLEDKLPSSEERRRTRRDPVKANPAALGSFLVVAVHGRNTRSFSQKLVGIHRVDAADGGPVKIRSAIVRYVLSSLISDLSARLAHIETKRRWSAYEELEPELVEIFRAHRGDSREQLREYWRLCNKRHANPLTSALMGPLAQLAVHNLSVVLSPRRQGLTDLAAGIATATDPQRD